MAAKQPPSNLWHRVKKRGPNACWPWLGKLNNSGYGTFSSGGLSRGAHVWAFALALGEPKNCVLHRCDNRRCCNPAHLFEGSMSDNSRDAWKKGRNFYQKKPDARPRGEAHANAVRTKAQVEKIRELYATGKYRQVDLAKKFRTSQAGISQIIRNVAWKE